RSLESFLDLFKACISFWTREYIVITGLVLTKLDQSRSDLRVHRNVAVFAVLVSVGVTMLRKKSTCCFFRQSCSPKRIPVPKATTTALLRWGTWTIECGHEPWLFFRQQITISLIAYLSFFTLEHGNRCMPTCLWNIGS